MRLLEKATEDWDVDTVPPLWLAFEAAFTRDLVDLRAERYVRAVFALRKSEVARMGSTIPSSRCGIVVMMLRRVVKEQVDWLNVQIGDATANKDMSEGDL